MSCPQCQGIEQVFNDRFAERELEKYHQNGPDRTTRLLIDALERSGVEEMSLLDIGGGVGMIQYALLKAGASRATSVDASTGYSEVAKREARAQGLADRITRYHGNFVDLAPSLEPSDIVTLDRVICCYDDMPALVGASVGLAKRLYGIVFPIDRWWVRAALSLQHALFRLTGSPMRFWAHPTHQIEALVHSHGFERIAYYRTFIWQVIVYAR